LYVFVFVCCLLMIELVRLDPLAALLFISFT
jgi:hypothetical protein